MLKITQVLVGFLASLALPGGAAAQEWPKQKPANFLVGFGPGSSTDIIARLLAQKVGEGGQGIRRQG